MSDSNPAACIVLTSVSSPAEAARMGRALVEERLAACATLVPGAQSIYHWKDAIETSVETLLVIKTGSDQLEALEARLHELHSYQTPEFLVLGVDAGSWGYLDWMQRALQGV